MAKLRIYSDIVGEDDKMFYEWSGLESTAFGDIDNFISSIPADDENIDLHINCRGGAADVALAMYDALRATGKVISSEVLGQCSSAATLLLLAGRKDLRKAHPNASILIHNPYIAGYVEGDAKQVGAIADSLEDITNKYLDIYAERTGSDREVLKAIMDENKPMSASRALELGFISEIIQPISAKNNPNKLQKMSLKEKLNVAFRAFRDALDIKGMSLETADGKTLELEKESGEPVVGDVVTSEDGEYLMPDNSVIVVEGGAIVEIRPAEEVNEEERGEESEERLEQDETDSEKDAEIDRLKAVIAEKDAEIDRLRQELEDAKSNAKSDDDRKVLDMVAVAGGMEWLKGVQSKGNVGKRETTTSIDAKAKKNEKLSFAEYRKLKAERKAQAAKK